MPEAALMVCTRDRPEQIRHWLKAVAPIALAEPRPYIVVVDNNDVPQEKILRDTAQSLGYEIIYAHCKERGYASPRNAALEAALLTDAEVLIFVDDDDIPEPTLVIEHIDALARLHVDVVRGLTTGAEHKIREGRSLKTSTTTNVSFRRWIVDGRHGVRFDPRLNIVGSEDGEFFRDARKAGAKITASTRPRVFMEMSATVRKSNRHAFKVAYAQSAIAIRRIRSGRVRAISKYLWAYGMPAFFTRIKLYAKSLMRVKNGIRRERFAIYQDEFARRGLSGVGLDREALKQGRIVEVRL
jgi:glycosyltransferase involved in cell wall biosynthesis